jgi:protein-S-isoprenylcysteine O-methyltransferase Ste14
VATITTSEDGAAAAVEVSAAARSVCHQWLARAFPASPKAVAINYVSAVALLLLGILFYRTVPYYRNYFDEVASAAFRFVAIVYFLVLPLYYATFPDGYTVKCRAFWLALPKLFRGGVSKADANALRAVAIKAFFFPLMINWLVGHTAATYDNWQSFRHSGVFFPDGYWFLYRPIFFADVLLFTIGYGVEHPRLGNEIRSTEPTLFGWAVALACYPPFAFVTGRIFAWQTVDYPECPYFWLQCVLAVLMLVLFTFYAWASVALGLKASNLTHRGVVRTGPYAWVRHPAYIAKNLAWWTGMVPFLVANIATSPTLVCAAIVGMAGWNSLYVMRAITEERHLGQDPEYKAYCEQVRYRFIPGIV